MKRAALALAVVCGALGLINISVPPAAAQSPGPSWYLYDSYPGDSFPPKAPYTSATANAVVVEGLGSISCSYSESSIEYWSAYWVNHGYQTATEISPQSYCGSLSQYESLISQIKNYVESNTSNPGRYWGGFMLDEEPGFDFSVSSLESLNTYTENVMDSTPGISWYWTENQPNGWSLSNYDAIAEISWLAPQAYSSSMVSAINNECYDYSECTNAVTVDSYASYPWDDWSWVTAQVTGSAWTNSDWGSGHWWNEWRDG